MGFFFPGGSPVQQTKTFTVKCLACEEEIDVFDIGFDHIRMDGYHFIEDFNAFCEKHVNHRIIILKSED